LQCFLIEPAENVKTGPKENQSAVDVQPMSYAEESSLSLSSLGRLEDLEKESKQAGGPPKMPQRPITDQARRIPIRQEGLPRPASLQAHPDQAAKVPRHTFAGHQSPISGKPNFVYGVFPLSFI